MVELGVRAVIKNKKDKFLLVRAARGIHKGKWSLPGGKVNFKESSNDAIEREIKEELNIEFEPKFLTYREDIELDPSQDYLTLFFTGTAKGEININPDEIQEYNYFSLDEVRYYSQEIVAQHKEILLSYGT